MRTGELRLGNYVYVRMLGRPEDQPNQVVSIYSYKVMLKPVAGDEFECSIPNLKGIPLTENFLLTIGMNRHATRNHLILTDTLVVGIENHVLSLFAFDEEDNEYIKLMEIQYLHQLQNVYYSATGRELDLSRSFN